MGVFWLSLGVLYVPALGIAASYSPDGTDPVAGQLSVGFNTSLGIYLICWGLATFVILICSMKTNLTFIILFAVLDAAFFMFSASYFQVAADNLVTAVVLKKVSLAEIRINIDWRRLHIYRCNVAFLSPLRDDV
jgi:uncharacterized protein